MGRLGLGTFESETFTRDNGTMYRLVAARGGAEGAERVRPAGTPRYGVHHKTL